MANSLFLSPAMTKAMMDSIEGMFDGEAWVALAIVKHDSQEVWSGSRKWYGHKVFHTRPKYVDWQSHRVHAGVERVGDRLYFNFELLLPSVDFKGMVEGLNIYAREHDRERLVLAPLHMTSHWITPGSTVNIYNGGSFSLDDQ